MLSNALTVSPTVTDSESRVAAPNTELHAAESGDWAALARVEIRLTSAATRKQRKVREFILAVCDVIHRARRT